MLYFSYRCSRGILLLMRFYFIMLAFSAVSASADAETKGFYELKSGIVEYYVTIAPNTNPVFTDVLYFDEYGTKLADFKTQAAASNEILLISMPDSSGYSINITQQSGGSGYES